MFERAGANAARSYISTGNVSFEIDPDDVDAAVVSVEADLELLLGRPTPLFVRRLDDLTTLLDQDPFAVAPFDEVHARLVTFFRSAPPPALQLPMNSPNGDWSVFAAGAAEVFSVTRSQSDRQPRDPGGIIQRVADEPVTTRAVGTIERIVAHLLGPETDG